MTCPICKKPTEAAFRPFCSNRCAQIDLVRWFNGDYAIPGEAAEDSEAVDGTDADTRH